MSNFNYTFRNTRFDYLISLDFKAKNLEIYINPWGRDSSGTPDFKIPFGTVKEDNVLTTELKPFIKPQDFDEIQLLCDYYAQVFDTPKGKKLFFLQTSGDNKRTRSNGFHALGTEEGLYVYDNNSILNYNWNVFTGKCELLKEEQSFLFELSVYNEYESNKANKYLNFVGIPDCEYYFNAIIKQISTYTPIKEKEL